MFSLLNILLECNYSNWSHRLVVGLAFLSREQCEDVTVMQIKKIWVLIDEAVEKNNVAMDDLEQWREYIPEEMSIWLFF